METPIHAFEKAGLGRAPFRFVGIETRRGPINLGNGCTVGAPGQPMGCCDFCGTGIADCYLIRSSDGRTFVVGCECVRKTGDAGLRREVDAVIREKRREKAAAKARTIFERGEALLESPPVIAALSAQPHPFPRYAAEGKTLLDSIRNRWAMSGATGRAVILKQLERAAAVSE